MNTLPAEARTAKTITTKTISLQAGQKCSLCTCGESRTLPYCDDTHKKVNAEKGTSYRPLKIWPKTEVELEVDCGNWEKINEI